MTTHMTKTWFDGKNIVTQEIPESEIYKREWVGLTGQEKALIASVSLDAHDAVHRTDVKLKEKNT